MNNTELLQQLRDIHAAPPPLWWPPAPGWWLLTALALLLIGLALIRLRRFWRRWRLQRYALRQLHQLYAESPPNEFAARLSVLLRRLALSCFPRQQVAGLHGKEWLEFLNRTGATEDFTQTVARELVTLPYSRTGAVDQTELYRLVKRWIRRNI